MPADRLLATVLRAYQDAPNPQQTNRILSTTTSLLTTLSNPLNVTLLTSQFLTARSIWGQVDGLQTSFRVISVYNTAAITVRKHEVEAQNVHQPRQLQGGRISSDDWVKAVLKGLDERSSRWQHVLVIAGVLLGMEGQERRSITRGLRTKLEGAIVTAVNLALEEFGTLGSLGAGSIVLALNHSFPLLSDAVRSDLNYDVLILLIMDSITSGEGYQDGYFLQAIDFDVKPSPKSTFDWSSKSPSFLQMQRLSTKPLVASMGPLSRLTAHAIEHLRDPRRVIEVQERLLQFSGRVFESWQRNKLSEVDPSEERTFLTLETVDVTFPVLWQILKTAMFATVVIEQAVVGRMLIDPALAGYPTAPTISSQALKILQNIYFVSSRLGSNSFSAYTFVFLTSIDILSRYPREARNFLRSICPQHAGQIPEHPLHRNLDLFYLNTSEQFPLILTPADCESLIVAPASPYLDPKADKRLVEIFEAAHSAMLAVLAAPQNAPLTGRVLPFYAQSLFASFPANLSPRQFRFAFKSLMQICTPPSPASASEPMLAETLLEFLRERALHAPTTPLPPSGPPQSEEEKKVEENLPQLSEQAVLVLTLLDALITLPPPVLEEWLNLSAELLDKIQDPAQREFCRARFWELLESGEMDVERAATSVSWWTTKGGRDNVLKGRLQEGTGPFMSGALTGSRESRL
ncbi:hypothetical protein F5884DRAFT_804879 [Xylogone sp. PMI_703]|nr:hypothetical protein F5884DRAFT_804879 [Xylogone sp. PMI_703]